MKLFNKPLGEYWQFSKIGIYLLALVSVSRFLMKPVFNVPYAQGTHFTSVTILLLVLMVVYAIRANAAGYSYRDLLGVAVALVIPTAALIILGIAIDDFGGIDTYYTDLEHGGNLSPLLHMGGHLIGALISSLVLWGVGALAYLLAGLGRKKAVA